MATKAYLMIRVQKKVYQNHRIEDVLADLKNIPEVKCVEQVDGAFDLLVKIEAPIRPVFTANKVLALDWVDSLRLLKVKSVHNMVHEEHTLPDLFFKKDSESTHEFNNRDVERVLNIC